MRDVCREHEIAWFSKLKERELWRSEYETQQDRQVGDRSLRRALPPPPHQFLSYKTPKEVAATWEEP